MNKFISGLQDVSNFTYTENGAVTHKTTKSDLLDMFAMGGAYRNRSDEDVILMFQKAYAENPVYALKCLFYLRDVRGGQGERRFFRVAMKWLARHDKAAALRNLKLTPEFGRWDDLYLFVGTALEKDAFAFMKEQLALDVTCKTPSLLAKWLKSENTSSSESRALANKTRAAFGMSHKQYRKTLSMLRERINVLERLMSAQKWDEIEFDKIPSKAGLIYKNAFAKHDVERMKNAAVQSYADFAQDDTKKVNAEVLNPVDIAHRVFTGQVRTETDVAMLDKYWANLKDYYNGREENGIAICDVSGSMCGQPMEAAVSMSAYIAERGKGPFKDHFLTFSDNPQFVRFEGANIADKFNRAQRADWGGSTNIEAAMNLLLKVAVENKVPAEDIPTRLYIFSDMEFNGALTYGEPVRGWYGSRNYVDDVDTLFETIEKRWARHGYEMPKVIFWNLDARQQNIPALGGKFSYVSGFSMNMVECILSGKDGYDLMMAKLDSERYSCVG
jgi:hypothetical protein